MSWMTSWSETSLSGLCYQREPSGFWGEVSVSVTLVIPPSLSLYLCVCVCVCVCVRACARVCVCVCVCVCVHRNIAFQPPYLVDQQPDEIIQTYLDTVGRPVVVVKGRNLVEQHIQDFKVHTYGAVSPLTFPPSLPPSPPPSLPPSLPPSPPPLAQL